ncbi:MAG TPA: hypothetical protein VNZ94_05310 [Xanthobacteraceae bacterium]|nr:hypothetical protein [Xanthobacteraceae bacterium]
MSAQPASPGGRTANWRNIITVLSAAILIGAEVFGAAFAGGWAFAILFDLSEATSHVLQALLFLLGMYVMYRFIRSASRIEPFFRRG